MRNQIISFLKDEKREYNKNILSSVLELLENDDVPIAICYGCNNSIFSDHLTCLPTSKWGNERPFCKNCRQYCERCALEYCKEMDYEHSFCF